MSGEGAAAVEPFDASGLRVAVVAASWHTEVMDGLLAGAARACADHSVEPTRGPGAGHLRAARSSRRRSPQQGYDAVVALGVVIRGGTPHFDYVCSAATDGLTRVALDHTVAVGFGVLTCDTDAAGPRPRRPRGVAGGQGPRGDLGRAGHRPDAARAQRELSHSSREQRVHHPVQPLAVPVQRVLLGVLLAAHAEPLHQPPRRRRCRRSTARSRGVRRAPRSRSAAPRAPPRWRSPGRRTPGRGRSRSRPGSRPPARGPRPATTGPATCSMRSPMTTPSFSMIRVSRSRSPNLASQASGSVAWAVIHVRDLGQAAEGEGGRRVALLGRAEGEPFGADGPVEVGEAAGHARHPVRSTPGRASEFVAERAN